MGNFKILLFLVFRVFLFALVVFGVRREYRVRFFICSNLLDCENGGIWSFVGVYWV